MPDVEVSIFARCFPVFFAGVFSSFGAASGVKGGRFGMSLVLLVLDASELFVAAALGRAGVGELPTAEVALEIAVLPAVCTLSSGFFVDFALSESVFGCGISG